MSVGATSAKPSRGESTRPAVNIAGPSSRVATCRNCCNCSSSPEDESRDWKSLLPSSATSGAGCWSSAPAQPPLESGARSQRLHLHPSTKEVQSLLRQLLSDSESPHLPWQLVEAGTNPASHVKLELPNIIFYSRRTVSTWVWQLLETCDGNLCHLASWMGLISCQDVCVDSVRAEGCCCCQCLAS